MIYKIEITEEQRALLHTALIIALRIDPSEEAALLRDMLAILPLFTGDEVFSLHS